jgi:hypothetical protein
MERMTAGEIKELKKFVDANRPDSTDFDIVVGGTTPVGNKKRAAATARSFAEAGATWWLESAMTTPDKLSKRINQGPPRFD